MTLAGASSGSPSTVEITVQDPATQADRVFVCPLTPLRTHMRFFEPLIQRQLNEAKSAPSQAFTSASASAAAAVPSGAPLTLRARCDHTTFQWLVEWMSGKSPALTRSNVVSVCLSSSFLQMPDLCDDALGYLSQHLPDIVASTFDLTNLPTHLVLRLSHMVRDTELAAALLRLHELREPAHPNRAFVASLLQHYAGKVIGLGEVAATEAMAPPVRTRDGTLVLSPACGLRWCRLCAGLFDEAELQRLQRTSQFSAPECPAQTVEGQTTAADGAGRQRAAITRCVGPRGELFASHAASRHAMPVVTEAAPAMRDQTAAPTARTSTASVSTAAAAAAAAAATGAAPPPQATAAASSSSPAELERWAWRLIGACRYVGCRRCFHLVPLLEVPRHHCSELPSKFTAADNSAEDISVLVRWIEYCAANEVYASEGGLTTIRYSGPAHVLAQEVVDVPSGATAAAAAAWSRGGDAAGVTGTTVTAGALLPSEFASSAVAAALGADAAHQAARPTAREVSFWATKPFYVDEVMSDGIVDIDILNYVERQRCLEIELLQRRASAAQNSVPMRLSVAPVVASAVAPGGGAGSAALALAAASPRPASSAGGGSTAGSGPRPRGTVGGGSGNAGGGVSSSATASGAAGAVSGGGGGAGGARGSRTRTNPYALTYGTLTASHR